MQFHDIQTAKRRSQAGLTLIELMIAILIATIVLAGVLGVVVTTLSTSRNTMLVTRLEQDLNSALLVIAQDIRRAGYWGEEAYDHADLTQNPFWTTTTALTSGASPSGDQCIRYTYNFNDDNPAVVDDSEKFGFRLNDGVIEVYDNPSGDSDWLCNASSNDWYPLTDSSFMSVTTFDVNTEKEFVASSASASIYTTKVTLRLVAELQSGLSAKDAQVTVTLGNSSAE